MPRPTPIGNRRDEYVTTMQYIKLFFPGTLNVINISYLPLGNLSHVVLLQLATRDRSRDQGHQSQKCSVLQKHTPTSNLYLFTTFRGGIFS